MYAPRFSLPGLVNYDSNSNKQEWHGPREDTDWQQFHRSVAGLLKMLEEQDEKIRFLEMRIGLCDKAETKLHEDLEEHKATDMERHGWAGGSISEIKDRLDQLSYELGLLEKKVDSHAHVLGVATGIS